MKKLLLLLVLIPVVTFSQVSSWRTNPPQPQRNIPSIQGQRSDISMWRNESPKQYNKPPQKKSGSNVLIYNDPFYGRWNRWDLWGAPMVGWNYYNPYWYWNDWGYRQPARIYVYENGKRDTIKGKKPIINFGLHKTTDKQIGGFFTIGNRGYFVMDFSSTYEVDHSTFFPYGTLAQVDFPLINDLIKKRSLYLGVGKRFNRTGVHAMLGFGKEIIRYRGKDRLGEITFPKANNEFSSIKVGVLHDFKNVTLKFDYEPIRKYSQLGLGLNF